MCKGSTRIDNSNDDIRVALLDVPGLAGMDGVEVPLVLNKRVVGGVKDVINVLGLSVSDRRVPVQQCHGLKDVLRRIHVKGIDQRKVDKLLAKGIRLLTDDHFRFRKILLNAGDTKILEMTFQHRDLNLIDAATAPVFRLDFQDDATGDMLGLFDRGDGGFGGETSLESRFCIVGIAKVQ